MDSEDELLCVVAAVIIQRKTLRKRKEKTEYGFSRFTEKERNMAYHI